MPSDLAFSTWRVPENGFEWTQAQLARSNAPECRFLVARPHRRERLYRPLDKGGLFQTFAELKPREGDIRQFANRYGQLGGSLTKFVVSKESDHGAPSKEVIFGETEAGWTEEITEMAYMVQLWRWIEGKETRRLSKAIQWQDRGVRHIRNGDPEQGISWLYLEIDAEAFSRFRRGDLIGPATHFLQRGINAKLQQHEVAPRLLWEKDDSRLGMYIVPTSLIACLWLQMAKAVAGQKEYRRCDNCDLWFELGGSRMARTDKRFCSAACKAAGHRKRRETAIRMASLGHSVSEIAEKVGSDEATVSGWIKL